MISLSLENKTIQNVDGRTEDVQKLIFYLSSLRFCISIDYLVVLYDFFINGLTSSPTNTITTTAIGDRSEIKINDISTTSTSVIENPQVVLVENQLDIENTNTFILDVR